MRQINDAGLKLIREFEGQVLKGYLDAVGKLTVGVGHLVKPGEPYKLGKAITQAESDRLLREDLKTAIACVEKRVTAPLTDNQFAALVSFVFNLGCGNFTKSTLRKLLNRGLYTQAAGEFGKWNKASGLILKGLTRRREAEQNLFLSD